MIYSADCGYITSHRDSIVKHMRKIHSKPGLICQWDEDSWQQYRQTSDDLPSTCPALPLNMQLFGNRCSRMLPRDSRKNAASSSKPRKDKTARAATSCKLADPLTNSRRPMPAISVRRIEGPSTSSQVTNKENIKPNTTVEPSPIVIVEKRMALRRRLARYERNLEDVERVADDLRDDIRRVKRQMAELGDVPVGVTAKRT